MSAAGKSATATATPNASSSASTKFVSKSQAYCYVINQDDAPSFVCDPKVTFKVEQSGGRTFLCKHSNSDDVKKDDKTTVQKFAMDGCTLGPQHVDMRMYLNQFRPIQDKVLPLAADVGVSSSVWLLGRHSTRLNNNLLFNEQCDDDLFRATLSTLFARMSASTAQLNEFMRLSWSVHIKCFEVFGDQIVDLFIPTDAKVTKVSNPNPPKVREHPQQGTVVTGLMRRNFKSPSDAYIALRKAFNQRRILIAETCVGSSRNLFGQRVLGTVGCVFIVIEIEQMLYPIHLAADGTFNPALSFKVSSNIQFNVLADIDALSYKPSRQDTVNIIPLDEFLLHGVKTSDDGRPKNAVTLNSSTLACSHKSLSTLSRVLRLLHKDPTENKAENSSSVELGDLSPQSASSSQFIPYRDSVLTRVLQPSLDGNFVNVVYLCISNDSNASVSHGLRMAMELRGLPQTVERKRTIIFDEPQQLLAPTATPLKKIEEVSGPFVGQGKRQYVDKLPRSSRHTMKHEGDVEKATNQSDDDDELFCENKVEESFWDTLTRLQKDQSSFLESTLHLADLELQRKKLFDSLGIAVADDVSLPVTNRQRTGTSISVEVDLSQVYNTTNGEEKEKKSPILSIFKRNSSFPLNPLDNGSGGGKERPIVSVPRADIRQDSQHFVQIPPMGSFSPTGFNENALKSTSDGLTSGTKQSSSSPNTTTVPNRPVYTPFDIGSPVFAARPPAHTLNSSFLETDVMGHEDADLSVLLEQKVPGDVVQPQPVDSECVTEAKVHLDIKKPLLPLRHVDAKVSNSPTMNVQLPSPFSGSFPPDKKMSHSNHNIKDKPCDSPMSTGSSSPSVYDNVDFVQLSLSASNVHMNNPASFIDVFEQQRVASKAKQTLEATVCPKVTPVRDYHKSSSLPVSTSDLRLRTVKSPDDVRTSLLTGKNIWSSPPPEAEPSRNRKRQEGAKFERSQSNSFRQKFTDEYSIDKRKKFAQSESDDKKTNYPSFSSKPQLLTVPDLGFSQADTKTFAHGVSLAVKIQRSDSHLTLPPLLSPVPGVDEDKLEAESTSPMRITVTKKTSRMLSKQISDDISDNETDSNLAPEENALLQAVAHSNLGAVQKYVAQGVSVSVKNSFERDALQIATRNGDLDVIKLLVRNGASTATRGRRGDTLFHIAGGNGHVHVLRWLADQGLMHTLLDMNGQSVAHVAARRGEVEVLRFLHEYLHMSLHEEDFDGMTPIQLVPKVALRGNSEGLADTRSFLISVQTED